MSISPEDLERLGRIGRGDFSDIAPGNLVLPEPDFAREIDEL